MAIRRHVLNHRSVLVTRGHDLIRADWFLVNAVAQRRTHLTIQGGLQGGVIAVHEGSPPGYFWGLIPGGSRLVEAHRV